VAEAYEMLYEVIEQEGPFDGILGFSHGATLAFGFLAQHAKKNPYDPPGALFRCAIFICSLPPFRKDDADNVIYDHGLQSVVRIPTVHVAGKADFVYEHSMKLHALCDAASAKLVVHSKGHEIPGDSKNVALIAAACRELNNTAMFG